MKHQNQKSVAKWCARHYAQETVENRLKDLFEEATEIAASLNIVSVEELVRVVKKSWEKSKADLGDRAQTAGEIGDVQIAAMWLASSLGIDAQAALDRKMEVNRKKTVAQSHARLDRKKKIFKAPS